MMTMSNISERFQRFKETAHVPSNLLEEEERRTIYHVCLFKQYNLTYLPSAPKNRQRTSIHTKTRPARLPAARPGTDDDA